MKRKTLLSMFAVLTVVLTFFKSQFGLLINPTAVMAGVGSVLLYIFWEAKRDIQALSQQKAKWADPKFWISFLTLVIASVNEQFGLHLPAEVIISILTIIVGILFKQKIATT